MTTDIARLIAEAYRWQRRLGNDVITAPHCHIVADPARPDVWDANHADEITAAADTEIDGVFAAIDRHLGHTPWRVVHTDGFTPDPFLARLALDGFVESSVTIQMVLRGSVRDRGPAIDLRPVASETDWDALLELVRTDHAEGARTTNPGPSPEFSARVVAGYRAKSGACHFHLALRDRVAVAYGAFASAPNGAGMIEDLFTLQAARRQGIATAMIAAFTDRLRAAGCHTVFLGAHATEPPKHLYHKLGFQPIGLARCWVKDLRQRAAFLNSPQNSTTSRRRRCS